MPELPEGPLFDQNYPNEKNHKLQFFFARA